MLKRAFLHLSKHLGLFHLARYFTRRGLRILCYHGFSLRGEAGFRPTLFIEEETFRRRLASLASHRFPVIGLREAMTALERDTLPRAATVITVDDGFYSVYCSG